MQEFMERAAKDTLLCARDLYIVLDALPGPISYSTLADGRIRFFNRAFRKTFGYGEDDFTCVEDWVQRAYPRKADRDLARRTWQEPWAARNAGVTEIGAIEIHIRCADDTVRIVHHRGILLHDIGIGIATFDDVTDRKVAEDALRRIAGEDALTGLANRRALQDHWRKEVRESDQGSEMAALLIVDLDGFKAVNDRLGHDAGDEVLIEVAARLRRSVRQCDFVCRIGGDEFVIFLPELEFPAQVDAICSRVCEAMQRPFTVGEHSVHLGASVGASIYPRDADSLQALMKRADEALYRVKGGAKGGWAWFARPSGGT